MMGILISLGKHLLSLFCLFLRLSGINIKKGQGCETELER